MDSTQRMKCMSVAVLPKGMYIRNFKLKWTIKGGFRLSSIWKAMKSGYRMSSTYYVLHCSLISFIRLDVWWVHKVFLLDFCHRQVIVISYQSNGNQLPSIRFQETETEYVRSYSICNRISWIFPFFFSFEAHFTKSRLPQIWWNVVENVLGSARRFATICWEQCRFVCIH